MKLIDFEKTLNYCMYICYDDIILLSLGELQIKMITNTLIKEDFKNLKKIEKSLMKEFK